MSEPGPAAAGVLAWSLFALDLLAAIGWVAFCSIASRFRGSFGASRLGAGIAVVPALGFLLLAVAACWPEVALLRWAAVGLAGLLAVAALAVAAKAPYLALGALLHGALWIWLGVQYAGA